MTCNWVNAKPFPFAPRALWRGMTKDTRKSARPARPPAKRASQRPNPSQTENTKDPAKGDRIAKVLARAGVASRRDAERMIEAGRVAVNGAVITSPALNVTNKDEILVDDVPLADPEPPRLWLYHKPTGLVTSARDEKGRDTVFDALPEDLPRVMSVGRLDLNSEGLLLLTNDGELKRKLELPSTGWTRKYRVRVNGKPHDEMMAPVRKGITIDGERFQPMSVSIDRQQGANAWLTVALKEGKNREIRRAMEAVGLSVNRLMRISYGPFQLGTLAAGEVEELRPRVLRDQLGLDLDRKMPVRKRAGGPDTPGGKTADAPRPVTGRGKAGGKLGGPLSGRAGGKADPAAGQKPGGKSGAKAASKPASKPRARKGPLIDEWDAPTGRGKPTSRGKPPSRGKPSGRGSGGGGRSGGGAAGGHKPKR